MRTPISFLRQTLTARNSAVAFRRSLHQWRTFPCLAHLPLPTWTATAPSGSTRRASLCTQLHRLQQSMSSRPAAAKKWTKGTAPSTQHGPPGYKPSGFRPTTLADQNPALLAYMTSHGNSPAPIPPALAKPAKSRRPGTCWVKGCFGTGHTKWQDCPKTAAYFTNHNGPGPMDTTVSKHSSSAHASHKRSASAAPPPPAQRR